MAFTGNPKTAKGFFSWVVMGGGAALAALLIAAFFPSLIPTSAQGTKL